MSFLGDFLAGAAELEARLRLEEVVGGGDAGSSGSYKVTRASLALDRVFIVILAAWRAFTKN